MEARVTGHSVLVVAVSVAVAGTLVLIGCGPNERRAPVPLTTARLDTDGRLMIEVPSCNGDPVVTEVVQEPDGVTVAVTSTTRRVGDSCLDGVTIDLDEPLGDRPVIDGTSRNEITVANRDET